MSRAQASLFCVAPSSYEALLTHSLKTVGFSVRFLAREEVTSTKSTSRRRCDPYELMSITHELPDQYSGIILVVPRRRSPRRVSPSPIVNGIPVGLLFSDHPRDLIHWTEGLGRIGSGRAAWAVLSMNRKSYLSRSRVFAEYLRKNNRKAVETWFSDSTTRYELCERLACGPRMVVYIGHGRAQGLSGYMGLRWHHLAEFSTETPVGTVMCFACDTLKQENGRFPFGCRWVMAGRALTYLGAVDAVPIKANTAFAHAIGQVFEHERPDSVGTLLRGVWRYLGTESHDKKNVHEALTSYRIIGNPLQSILL